MNIMSRDDKRSKIHIALTMFFMVFIFIHSAMPADISSAESNVIVRLIAAITDLEQELLQVAVRKVAHFMEFMFLGICLMLDAKDWANRTNRRFPNIKLSSFSWMIGTLYAVSDEIHQIFVPGRSCALLDVGIDSAGVLTGVVITALISMSFHSTTGNL